MIHSMITEYFQDIPNIVAGTTTRLYGDCSVKHKVIKDKQPFYQKLIQNYHAEALFVPRIIHSDKALNIAQDDLMEFADALICNTPQQLIAVSTADCIPIFLYEPISRSIGIVHSGRIGLRKKIIIKTIQKMKEDFSISLSQIIVQIGPHICARCYEVGAEILAEFDIPCSQQKGYLPMQDILIKDLLSIGISYQQIRKNDECTFCTRDDAQIRKYFSYRDHGDQKRMLSFIGISD